MHKSDGLVQIKLDQIEFGGSCEGTWLDIWSHLVSSSKKRAWRAMHLLVPAGTSEEVVHGF